MQNYVTLKVSIFVDYEDLFAQCSVGSHISRLNRPRTEQREKGAKRAAANEVESGPKRTLLGNGDSGVRDSPTLAVP